MVPNSSPLLGYAGVVSWKLIKDSILNAISGTAQKVQSYLEWISNVPNLFIPGAKLTTRKTQETSRCCHYIPIILYRDSILIMHIIPPFLLVTSQLFMVLWPTLRFRCTGAGGGPALGVVQQAEILLGLLLRARIMSAAMAARNIMKYLPRQMIGASYSWKIIDFGEK